MLKDITLGQYYPAPSVIHKLDPRVKLAGTIIFIIALFAERSPYVYLMATFFLIGVIRLSKVPFKFIVRGLKTIVLLLVITSLFNVFLTDGEVIFKIWKLKATKEGLILAFYMCVRLIYFIMGSSIMTFTTTPNNLTDGLEKALGFLKVIKVPVHEIAMMMSIALRFIPILVEETDKIMKAQMARGADFESGSLINRVKAMIPLLLPLIVSAVKRANDLALAMEARCYAGGKGRTKMKPLKYHRRDYIAYVVLILYLVAVYAGKNFI